MYYRAEIERTAVPPRGQINTLILYSWIKKQKHYCLSLSAPYLNAQFGLVSFCDAGSPGRLYCIGAPQDSVLTLWVVRMERASLSPSSLLEALQTCVESSVKETVWCLWVSRAAHENCTWNQRAVFHHTQQTFLAQHSCDIHDCHCLISWCTGEWNRPPRCHSRTGSGNPEERRTNCYHSGPVQTRR